MEKETMDLKAINYMINNNNISLQLYSGESEYDSELNVTAYDNENYIELSKDECLEIFGTEITNEILENKIGSMIINKKIEI